jgi:hypothetical protein
MGRTIRAFLLVVIAAAGQAAADPYQHAASGFECADQVAGFARVSVVDYEAQYPGLGVACKYRLQDGFFADVYIYSAGLRPVPREATHPALQRLHAQTVQEIEQYAASRGEQARPTESATLQIDTAGGAVPVLYDAFVIDSPQGMRQTWLWLWSARGHVMKIRMTRFSEIEADPAKPREFLQAVVRTAAN